MYGWIITKDVVSNGEDEGRMGPRSTTLSADDIKSRGRDFRMYDDDSNLYYEGKAVWDKDEETSGFAPLENFGTPNAGCTYIKYLNKNTNKWETL